MKKYKIDISKTAKQDLKNIIKYTNLNNNLKL